MTTQTDNNVHEPVADINVRPSPHGGLGIASVLSHKLPVGSWLLYTTPPQRNLLTDERLELIGHADLTINNIYIFNGYGEEVPEGRTPIYAGYKAAHGIKE